MLEFVKAQEEWSIEGGNAVEPRIAELEKLQLL